MRACAVTALACLAMAAVVQATPSIDTSQLPPKVAEQYAIFAASSSAATATSFTLEHTRVTITKHGAASSSALAAGKRRPRIIVTDAVAKGLVCVPSGSVSRDLSAGAGTGGSETATVAVGGGVVGDEGSKADIVVGQGEGITATVGTAAAAAASGSGAAASASGGGAAASSAAGVGGAASSASGGGAAAASSSGESSSSAASSGGSSATSASGDAEAAAAGAGSASHSSSHEGEIVVDVSGEGAEAAALGAGGTSVTLSGDGSYTVIDESLCECVPAYLCDEEGFINTFGSGLIDIRTFADKPARAYASKCKADEACCRHRDGPDKAAIGWLPSACGTRSPIRLDRRIVGGEASRIGKYPWMVALLKSTPGEDDEYLCGGSLIAEDVVLTGAHCVDKHRHEHLIARVGEWDTSTDDPTYPHYDIEVSRIVAHEDFNDQTLFNDVALLKLKEPATISPHINVLCLPTTEHANFDYHDCVATGWGKESFHNSHYSNILKEVPLSVVPHDQCQDRLRTTRLGRWFRLHDSFTCAGGEPGVDTCKGDGGSPLICRVPAEHKEDESFVQVGIVAWGIGCGKGGIPGVYADVVKLLPWIQEHLPELSAELQGYP